MGLATAWGTVIHSAPSHDVCGWRAAVTAIIAVALTARQRTRTEFRRFRALTKLSTSPDDRARQVAAILETRCCDSASLEAAAAVLSPREVFVVVNSANQIIAKFGKPLQGVDDLRLSRAGSEITIYLTPGEHGRSASEATLMIHADGTPIHFPSDASATLYVFPLPDEVIEQPESIFLGSLDRSLLLVTGLVATAALAATWIVTRSIVGPVEELREAARALAMGT